jgi:hypothetical protein
MREICQEVRKIFLSECLLVNGNVVAFSQGSNYPRVLPLIFPTAGKMNGGTLLSECCDPVGAGATSRMRLSASGWIFFPACSCAQRGRGSSVLGRPVLERREDGRRGIVQHYCQRFDDPFGKSEH